MSEGLVVRLRDRLGGFPLDVAFEAPARGVTALFGPSGSGKTSVLRCVAGLHRAGEADIRLNGVVWDGPSGHLPAHRRPVGYVFQEASLFPHLRVRDNLAFGFRRATRHGAAGVSLDAVVAMLGLDALLDRWPTALSGGERQRVAIGRALLAQPRLLLMDEPLSALDRASRDDILPYLESLHAGLSLPVLYVSHDMAEVERLADRLVLLETGRVVAAGALEDLQADPALSLLRGRGAAATLSGRVLEHDSGDGLTTFAIEGGRLILPTPPLSPGSVRRLRVAAADVSLACVPPERSSILNVLPATIRSAIMTGQAEVTVVLGLGEGGGGARLLARVTRRSYAHLGLAEGQTVFAQVKGVAMAPARLDAQA